MTGARRSSTVADTKISLFFALNTLFSLGVLRFVGGVHDAWSTSLMLAPEVLVGVSALARCVVLSRYVG